jgi:type III secretion protein V
MTVHAVLSRVRGGSDIVFAAVVLSVVALLFAPMPPALLDVAIAVNLGLSAAILVVTLFARDALRFASFPTLLLFTTLFRLALNVSSTRLVLARGDAGRVIEALGRVVVDGDTVVGVVVFAILAVVQILVVAKGSERVAEVAARFTLDALPGKQMSIDADLRAGAIDQATARARRRAIERESQLYGAMDGALKFVKGDAFAGILIVLVNVCGGAVAGVMRGMSAGDALARYALLAIGDGLASQVPALLLAIAAGVAVTRVSAEDEGGSLGGDIARQILAQPRALGAVAALLAALALAPGLPALPFALAGAAAGAAAAYGARRSVDSEPARTCDVVTEAGASSTPVQATSPVQVELAEDLMRIVAARSGGVDGFARSLAEALWRERGVPLPAPLVRAARLGPGEWCVSIDEVPAAGGALDTAVVLALAPMDELELVAIAATPASDPCTGSPAALVAKADATRARALAPVRDTGERLAAEIGAALRNAAAELLGVEEVQRLLESLEASAPALVREVARTIPPASLAEVLRRLLDEQVSIRPLRLVLQAALEATGAAPAAVAERCRRALKRHIAHACGAGAGVPLEALLLDPGAESRLRDVLCGEVLALSPAVACELVAAVECGVAGATSRSVVLLTPPDVRRPLRQLVAGRFPSLAVLSYDELPQDVEVRPVGRVALAA